MPTLLNIDINAPLMPMCLNGTPPPSADRAAHAAGASDSSDIRKTLTHVPGVHWRPVDFPSKSMRCPGGGGGARRGPPLLGFTQVVLKWK